MKNDCRDSIICSKYGEVMETTMKRVIAIVLIIIMGVSMFSSCSTLKKTDEKLNNDNNEDSCSCCPNCIQEECECIECGSSNDCECKSSNYEGGWVIAFENATVSSPNKNLPQYFIEIYTLNFISTKAEGASMLGEYTANGDLVNIMDTSAALAAGNGKTLVDEME